jgi:hypothetical protein
MSGPRKLKGGLKFLAEGRFAAGSAGRGLEITRFFPAELPLFCVRLRILGQFVRGLGGFPGHKTGVQPGLAASRAPRLMGKGSLKFLGEGRFAAGSAGRGPEIMRVFSAVSAFFLSGLRFLARNVSGLGGLFEPMTDAQPGFVPSCALVPVPVTARAPTRRAPRPILSEVRR